MSKTAANPKKRAPQKSGKKFIINGQEYDYNDGCRLVKAKFRECPTPELEDFWDDIQPMTFREIAQNYRNVEQRRVAISCLGMENVIKEVQPELVNEKTLKKETYWVNQSGGLVHKKFDDTYRLYKVDSKKLLDPEDQKKTNTRVRTTYKPAYYVQFKDTSTDREYMLWVDNARIAKTNGKKVDGVDAIQAIAWTIQTDIEPGGIEKIVRQGDCIMIKKKPKAKLGKVRHLTQKEYQTLIELES